MAKTSRSKKSKQDQISEDLKVRIIATVGLFLIVVGAMKLGPIGEQLNFLCTYIIGNFVGISYISLVLISGYVIYFAKLPKFTGPRAIGLYMVVGAVLTFMSSLNDDLMVGMKVINQYVSTAPCNRGGFLGAVLYGILSALFDKTGAMIAAGFILVIGLTLFIKNIVKMLLKERKRNPLKKILKCIKALVNSQIFLPLKKIKQKAFFQRRYLVMKILQAKSKIPLERVQLESILLI